MRIALIGLLLTIFLGAAAADEPPSAPPPPPPPPRGPLPTLGGPPPAYAPTGESPVQPWVSPPAHGGKTERIQQFGWDDWQEWWELNLGPYERLKRHVYRQQMAVMPKPLHSSEPEHHRPGRWTRMKVKEEILPALVRVLETGDNCLVHPSARLHALLSLGKLARDEGHVRLMLRWAQRPDVSGPYAQARVLLALGLLRRTHPADRFPGALLDEIRVLLIAQLEDGRVHDEIQRSAAIALGLLGDQPTLDRDMWHRRDAVRLFENAAGAPGDPSVTPAILLAIGQLHPAGTTEGQRELLRTLAWKRGRGASQVAPEVKAWAIWALGRVGSTEDVASLRRAIQRPRLFDRPQRWCAALALGAMGRRFWARDREEVARALRKGLVSTRDGVLRGYLLVGLGQALAAAAEAAEHDTYEPWLAHTPLFDALRLDQGASRGYAALALGLLARSIDTSSSRERAQSIRAKALEALRRALDDERHPRTQAAAAIALGLAADAASRKRLLTYLTNEACDARIPPAAAWALGLLEYPTKEVATRLAETAQTTRFGRLRQRSLRALALLGHPQGSEVEGDAVDALLRELVTSKTQEERWEVITLLGRTADDRAIGPLLEILESQDRSGWEQGAAALALGCIGDLEEETALDRLRRGVHYRSSVAYGAIRLP